MSEQSRSLMKNTLRTSTALLAGASVLSLAGCSSEFSPPNADLTPKMRYIKDYASYRGETILNEQGCLVGTAYDTTKRDAPTYTYNAASETLTVTPASGVDAITFTGFNQFEHTLEPADETSIQAFQGQGCNVEKYDQK